MPRPKRTDMVPHPLHPEILVSRYVAEYWASSLAKTPEQRAQEELARRCRMTLTPKLEQIPDWQSFLRSVAPSLGHTYESLRGAFERYDEAVMMGNIRAPIAPIVWGNYERTYQQRDGSTRTVVDRIEPEADRDILPLVDHILAQLAQLDGVAPKPSPKAQPAASADALRKRRARAEGRVKPRLKKGPQTTDQRIAATEKALATRQGKLAELKGNPSWAIVSAREVMSTEEGIRRTEKALTTLRARLQKASGA